MRKLPRIERSEIRGTFIVLSGQNILFVEFIFHFCKSFCVIFQNKEGRLRGCVRCALRRVLGVWVCRVCVGRECVCVGACVCVLRRGWVLGVGVFVVGCVGALGVGASCRRVTLAALLSGYLGKSGHLPR